MTRAGADLRAATVARPVDAGLAQAAALHRGGQLAAAIAAYQAVLVAAPGLPAALHGLGVAYHQQGRSAEAVALLERALQAQPTAANWAFNCGLALLAAGQPGNAATRFRAAARLRPDWPEAFYNLGNALRDAGDAAGAIAAYRRAMRLRAGYVAAEVNLANVLRDEGQLDAAIAGYHAVLAGAPGLADIWNSLGAVLVGAGDRDAAEMAFRTALRHQPALPQAQVNLGALLMTQDSGARAAEAQALFARAVPALRQAQGLPATLTLAEALVGQRHYAEAADLLREAAVARPDDWRVGLALADTLLALGRAVEAEAALPAAVPVGAAERWRILRGMALRDRQLLAESAAELRLAVRARPASAPARYHLAQTLLQQGSLQEGFAAFEARIAVLRPARADAPAWDGRVAAGRRILVLPEQGLGDTIQFARYLPRLAAAGARVTAIVAAPLLRLLATLPGDIALIEQGAVPPPVDAACLLMSLPHLLGGSALAPLGAAYLRADPAAVDDWRGWLRHQGPARLRVSVSWAGNPGYALDHLRSIPAATMIQTLAAVDGVRLVALQPEAPPDDLPIDRPAARSRPEPRDLADTAALIMALDLVITVDTVTAHLAGALGKPVWLLNRANTCWRWQSGTADSVWYESMRQFRQADPGDWSMPLARAAAALADWVRTL